jgi:coproporphyrinogen III oxidase-like Fe-S oxidoreductase
MPVLTELPLTYGCQGNLAFASPEKFDAMVKAGFVNVEFGYETANEEVVKGLGKNNRAGRSADLINYAADAGLSPVLFAQVGLPGENAETLRESVAFLRRLRPEVRVSVALTTPYRGTRLWREGVAAGQIPESLNGIDLYRFTGRIGHELSFEQEAAERFADDFGPNHRLTPEFLDSLEHSLTSLFAL